MVISASYCVIQTVLKVNIAIAVIEMPMATNLLGLPGVEISVVCVRPLKSARLPSMVDRLMAVTELEMAFNGSSCLARSWL